MEVSVKLVREEAKERVKVNAELPPRNVSSTFFYLKPTYEVSDTTSSDATRDKFRSMLRNGELDDRTVEADLRPQQPNVTHHGSKGMKTLGPISKR